MDKKFVAAVQSFWDSRETQAAKQVEKGVSDTGGRSSVTGGTQMAALEDLVVSMLKKQGLPAIDIRTRSKLELPGYFRPEKMWDLVVVSKGQLVCAIEFKSMVGPSFGNNYNNRTEEALGNSLDIWTAYREGLFGTSPRPFLGFFFLLEDCERVHRPVRASEPHFKIDPVFDGASYAKRYEILCRRLILERHYDGTCLTLATNGKKTVVRPQADDLSFERFMKNLMAAGQRFC